MDCRRIRVTDKEHFHASLETFTPGSLEKEEVLIAVDYSSINYKDALALKEKTGVLRSYPMTPGIDLAGTVIESTSERFIKGDAVLVTGYGLGVSKDGGWSDRQIVPADWVIKRPKNLSARQAMLFGTAGFTAALCVQALLAQGLTEDSRVVVTGATGGVGSFALHFLKQVGCKEIIALSRKTDQKELLLQLGATRVETPEMFFPEKKRPLNKQCIDFVIDPVGGETLSQLLPLLHYNGAVALCGNAGGIALETTVLPFILRGVSLIGIDSVEVSSDVRFTLWQKMAQEWQLPEALPIEEIPLEAVIEASEALIFGKHIGRSIVRLGGEK